jgi:hypothetical protein
MVKTKVVDFNEFYNFVVDDYFVWNQLVTRNFVQISQILKFNIWIFQIKFDREMAKTKVLDLDEFYNFVVDDFFIWNLLLSQNYLLCQNIDTSHTLLRD